MNYSVVTFYTTPHYTSRALRLRDSVMKDPKCDNFFFYNQNDIIQFQSECQRHFKEPKGYGYMCWKPYVILKAMEQMDKNSLLLYIDADLELIDNTNLQNLLIKLNSLDALYFYIGEYNKKNYTQGRWTKMDTFIGLDQNNSEQHNNYQIMSGLQFYRKTNNIIQLLTEVLNYCKNFDLISDHPSTVPNLKGFQQHRHDQSILSIIVHKWIKNKKNIYITVDPTQFGKDDPGIHYHCFQNHGIANEIPPMYLPIVSVITPTICHSQLERAIQSVQNQVYQNIEHVIVLDDPNKQNEFNELIRKYSNKRRTIYSCILPYNTGKNNWNGHRVYASFPHLLHHSDYICYLDEDNWFNELHIHSLIDTIRENNLDWAYSLRNIYDQDGKFMCKDLCESLGSLSPVFNDNNDHLIDTSCYLLSRDISMQTSYIWNKPTRGPFGEPDRQLCKVLLDQVKNYKCTNKFTVNYTTSNRLDSVNSHFFIYGNDIMQKKYNNNIPWNNDSSISPNSINPIDSINPMTNDLDFSLINDSESQTKHTELETKKEIETEINKETKKDELDDNTLYIFHFTAEATNNFLTKEETESVAYKEWQLTLLDYFRKEYKLVDGYKNEDKIPTGAKVLVHICLPQCLPMKTLNRRDIMRIGYTLEGPNIRHQQQWDINVLEGLFDKILTYWSVLLDQSKKTYFCPFIHRINFENELDKKWIYDNKSYQKTICMILEYRNLQGRYMINGKELNCLDPKRGEYAKTLESFLTVYGQNWDLFKKMNNLEKLKIGHTIGKFKDTRANVEIMRDYTFNLIIENCDAEDYVSEKFCDALVAGCIPIYYGNIGERMREIIPQDIYIDLRKYNSPEEFAKIFNQIGIKEIMRLKENIKKKRQNVLEALSPKSYLNYFKSIY